MTELAPNVKPQESLVVSSSPEECFNLRRAALELMDLINAGHHFPGLDVVAGIPDEVIEKSATVSLPKSANHRTTMTLAYHHSGVVGLSLIDVSPSESPDCSIVNRYFCDVGCNRAEILQTQGPGFDTVILPADQIDARDLNFWHRLIDQVGEPVPLAEKSKSSFIHRGLSLLGHIALLHNRSAAS